MTTILTEKPRAGCYIAKPEVDINLSRRVIVIASGAGILQAGTVLGKVTSSGKYVQHDQDADTGQQVAAAILFDEVDATSADVEAVATTALTAANESELVWQSDIDASEKAAAVAALATHDIAVLSATPAVPSVGATKLAFVAPMPDTGTAATNFGPIHVRIENDEGVLVIGDNTTSVALAKTSGGGTLTVTTPVVAVNGIATFPSVSQSVAATIVLTASASGLTSAVSGNIIIS